MTQPRPNGPSSLDTAVDPTHIAALLQAAQAYLATAFHLLQCQAAHEARTEAQVHIWLAREEIEEALEHHEQAGEEGEA